MKNIYLLGWILLLAACGDPNAIVQDANGVERGPVLAKNSLNLNSLNLNSLNLNSLNLNSLNLNSLNLNSLTPNSLNLNSLGVARLTSADGTGALAREALKYMVSCAFEPDQTFSFSWVDSQGVHHPETYPGLMGIAPQWQNRALTDTEEHMLSACLAARVNYYQVPVSISSRSKVKPLRKNSPEELAQYANIEGAFWGNLFGNSPYINTCYNSENIANSRAWRRDCAVGHLAVDPATGVTGIEECGIINIVGDCATVCKRFDDQKGFYWKCDDQGGRTNDVITTALP